MKMKECGQTGDAPSACPLDPPLPIVDQRTIRFGGTDQSLFDANRKDRNHMSTDVKKATYLKH